MANLTIRNLTIRNLTIRNLTVNPLDLVSVERFEGKRVGAGYLHKATSLLSSGSSKPIAAHGDAVHKEEVNGVRVEPFATRETDVRAADQGKEVVRLTFKAVDHLYETDVPSSTNKSAVMRRLDDGPLDLTVIYIPTGALLAVFSSAALHAWMKELHDEWPLSLLSIPGTHNSPTCHKALPSVRCQAVGVPEQLRNGVRFLDIRVSVSADDERMSLVHSVFPISLTGSKYFGDMVDEIHKFLDDNPSETILMSLKREGTGRGTDESLSRHLKAGYVDKKPERWWTEPKIPTLGAARGRIVVIRRFNLDDSIKSEWDGRGYGINAGAWPDNCEDGTCDEGHIRVQDFYEITESQNIQKKIDFSHRQLERAAEQSFILSGLAAGGADAADKEPAHLPFFVNFLSASNFFNSSCWPEKIAVKVNPSVIEYLCVSHGEDGKGPNNLKVGSASTGVVVTDWVGDDDDWDLIRCIVGMNARLQLKR